MNLCRFQEKIFIFKNFWKNFLFFSFTLGSIGPILSFFTLQTQLGYGFERTVLYAVVSFVADLLSILIFAQVYSLFTGSFEEGGKEAIGAYIPMWLFDIFDAYQPLRFMSNLGFVISLIILYYCIEEKGFSFKVVLALLLLWSILYALDGILSEAIALSPVAKEIFERFLNQTG